MNTTNEVAPVEDCMSFWHLNICGLDRHHHQLEMEVETHQPDIIGLTETHHVEEPRELNDYTFIGSKAPSTSKSVTGFYIKNFRGRSERVHIPFQDPVTEGRITAHIFNNMYLIEAYAPCQGKRIDDFYEYLNSHATDAETRGLPLLIMGDFNGHI